MGLCGLEEESDKIKYLCEQKREQLRDDCCYLGSLARLSGSSTSGRWRDTMALLIEVGSCSLSVDM